MKHKICLDLGFGGYLEVVCFSVFLSVLFLWVALFLVSLVVNPNAVFYNASTFILGSIIVLMIGIIVFVRLYSSILNSAKRRVYTEAISNAYIWSIQAALKTEYPQGIIYILENTLQQLQQLNLNYMPYRKSELLDDETTEIRGFPNTTNLGNAIRMAEDISREWPEISIGGASAQIQAMQGIKNLIRPEEMRLGWESLTNIKVGKQIYWYSYSDEDHQAVSGFGLHDNEDISPNAQRNQGSGSTPPSPPPPKVILIFEEFIAQTNVILTKREFIAQNPGLLYEPHLQDEEYHKYQKQEHHKYLASMGVQPPYL